LGTNVKVVWVIVACCLLCFGCWDETSSPARVASKGDVPEKVPCPKPEGTLPEGVLARICGREITVEFLQQQIDQKSPYLRERLGEREHLREFLEGLVRFEVLLVEARQRGLAEHPDVLSRRDHAMVKQLRQALLEDTPATRIDEIDDEIEAYYRAHQDEFSEPENVRASHIELTDPDLARKLLSQILGAGEDAELFGRLAREHSQDAKTRDRGGDLGYFPSQAEGWSDVPEIPREVAEVASSLGEVGDVQPELVRSSRGWHIVKLTDRQEAWHRTLEDARSRIRNHLSRKRRQDFIDAFAAEAQKRLHVQVNEAALDLVWTTRRADAS
jgi:peptidyl-prolyl cis-trans isomerase C